MKLAATLARLTVRLRAVATNAGSAVKDTVHGFANDARAVADNLVVADRAGAAVANRFAPDMPVLSGLSLIDGSAQTFRPTEVRSLPILGSTGTVVGVHFPSQLTDPKQPMVFAEGALESLRREYHQYPSDREPERPEWAVEPVWPAPWKGRATVFARAHAYPDGYNVQVKRRIPFTRWSRWVPVAIDGRTYGTILAADTHFKQAVRGSPTASLIQLSCSPAAGTAARDSAKSLHSTGINFDVYATDQFQVSTLGRGREWTPGRVDQAGEIIEKTGTEMELNDLGYPTKSPWHLFEAPRQRPDAPT